MFWCLIITCEYIHNVGCSNSYIKNYKPQYVDAQVIFFPYIQI